MMPSSGFEVTLSILEAKMTGLALKGIGLVVDVLIPLGLMSVPPESVSAPGEPEGLVVRPGPMALASSPPKASTTAEPPIVMIPSVPSLPLPIPEPS
jgi:hypothetical protein